MFCQGDIYAICIDEAKSFEYNESCIFNDFILGVYDFAPTRWLCNLNTNDEWLGMRIGGATHPLHKAYSNLLHLCKSVHVAQTKHGFVVGDVKK